MRHALWATRRFPQPASDVRPDLPPYDPPKYNISLFSPTRLFLTKTEVSRWFASPHSGLVFFFTDTPPCPAFLPHFVRLLTPSPHIEPVIPHEKSRRSAFDEHVQTNLSPDATEKSPIVMPLPQALQQSACGFRKFCLISASILVPGHIRVHLLPGEDVITLHHPSEEPPGKIGR